MLKSPDRPLVFQEKKDTKKIKSDLETFDGREREIEIKLDANGFPKAVAFFDIDKTLAECGFIHGVVFKKLSEEMFPDQDPDKMTKLYLNGLHLGTTFRVFHRMAGIAQGKDWADPQKYLEWLPGHEKEVDEEGPDHDFAAELSIKGSRMAAQMAEEMYRKDPQTFEQAKIKPVFHLARLYQRLGIPMVVMTANDEPFAKAACKCLGLADSFITLACQKDFVGRGKEGAIEYLIERLKEKGVPVPKNLIVVGDSLNGDIGSGAKFMQEHSEYSMKGVLVGEGDVEATKERIKNDPQLENMPVEVLNPSLVSNDKRGMPSLARYRKKHDTK